MNDVEGLQNQIENLSNRLDIALHKLAEYQRVVAGAVSDGVYHNNDFWWHELCRLEREQKGGTTLHAPDEGDSPAEEEFTNPYLLSAQEIERTLALRR